MDDNFAIQLFEGKRVRIVWDAEQEKYYFSIVDIVQVLTDSTNPTDYLKKLRKRDQEVGLFLGTNCPQVMMTTLTGKKRLTLAADLQGIFRLIQSIPSKKAEQKNDIILGSAERLRGWANLNHRPFLFHVWKWRESGVRVAV